MKRLASLLATLLVVASAGAHEDRRLSLSRLGAIPELPSEYSSTRIHIAFVGDSQGRLKALSFYSSGHETTLPPCLLELVRARNSNAVSLSGSWYHDEKLLPHYVQVKFTEPSAETESFEKAGTVFLFSLRDARLLEVIRVEVLPKERAVQHRQIKLMNGCPR